MSEHWDFWHVWNISRDFERGWARAFFLQLVHDNLSQLSKEFEHYFPTTKDPQTGKEWICNSFVSNPGESTLSMLEEDQLLEIEMMVASKVWDNFKFLYFWLKSKRNILRLSPKHRKASFHFWHPLFAKQSFPQWQQPKWNNVVDWT